MALKRGAALLVAVAAFATLIAFKTYATFCVYYEGEDACLGRRAEFVWHRILAIAGLVATLVMAWLVFRGQRRSALALLLAAAVIYLGSYLFSDAGVHGWDGLRFYPTL